VVERGPANQGVSPVRPTIIDQGGHRPQLGHIIGEPSIPAAPHLGVQTADGAASPREGPAVVAPSQTETNVPVPRPVPAERTSTLAERSLAGPAEVRPDLPVPRPIPAERTSTPAQLSPAGPAEVRPDVPVPRPVPAERTSTLAERSLAGPAEVRPDLPVPRPIPAERTSTPAERPPAEAAEVRPDLPVPRPIPAERTSTLAERSLAGPAEVRPDLPVPRPIPAERTSTLAERSLAGAAEVRPDLPVPRPIPAERTSTLAERSLAGAAEVRPDLPVPRPIPAERTSTPAERSPAEPVEPKATLSIDGSVQTEKTSASPEATPVHLAPAQRSAPEAGATPFESPLPHLVHARPPALGTRSLFSQGHPHSGVSEEMVGQPLPFMPHLLMREPRDFSTRPSELSRRVISRLTSDITSSGVGDVSGEHGLRPIGMSPRLPELRLLLEGSTLADPGGYPQAENRFGGQYASVHPIAQMLQQTIGLYPVHNEVGHESMGRESTDWEHDKHLFDFPGYTHELASMPGKRTSEARLPLAVGGFSKRSEESAPVIARAPSDRPNAADTSTASVNSGTTNHAQPDQSTMGQVDLDSLAREVYQIIKRRMCVEKERCAFGS
jgi:hypothetical protein